MIQSDVDAVTAANEEFYAAFEAVDLDRMDALWDDDASVTCVHPGWQILRGRSRILRSWALIFANTHYIQFFLTDVKLAIAPGPGEPNIAVVTCAENVLSGAGSDETFAGGKAIATNIFVRDGSAWKLWMHHSSPVATMVEE